MTTLEAALDYLSRGWSVLPCDTHKRAMCSWKRFQQRRPTPQEVEFLWKRYPGCNVAVITGSVSQLVGLDIDGPLAIQLAEDRSGGAISPSLTFVSPGGGTRVLYALPQGVTIPRRKWSEGDSHVVVLGEGSYTLAHPSVHANGGLYPPFQGQLQPAPKWLLDLQERENQGGEVKTGLPIPAQLHDQRMSRALKYLSCCGPAISGQNGHAHTFKITCALMHGFHLSDEETLQQLCYWNMTCSPPWSDKELHHKITEARQRGSYPDLLAREMEM